MFRIKVRLQARFWFIVCRFCLQSLTGNRKRERGGRRERGREGEREKERARERKRKKREDRDLMRRIQSRWDTSSDRAYKPPLFSRK